VQGNLHLQRNAHVRVDIKNHTASTLPPPPQVFTVVLLLHGAWSPASEPVNLLLEYEGSNNMFLHSGSIMYTPTYMLAAAERAVPP